MSNFQVVQVSRYLSLTYTKPLLSQGYCTSAYAYETAKIVDKLNGIGLKEMKTFLITLCAISISLN